MSAIDPSNSFAPLTKIINETLTSATVLEKYTLLSSTQLNDLNEKLKHLSLDIQLLSGYNALTKEDKDQLDNLRNKVTILTKDNPLLTIIRGAFRKNISTTLNSIKDIAEKLKTTTPSEAKLFTQATWVGILAKEGRTKESLNTLETISDPKLKMEAYVELIKAGKLNTIMQKVEIMQKNELNDFIKTLNTNSKDPIIQDALKMLPGCIALASGVDKGLESISKIPSDLQTKAILHLAKSGGINQVVLYIKNASPDEKTFFLSELQKLAEDKTAQLLLTEINLKDPPLPLSPETKPSMKERTIAFGSAALTEIKAIAQEKIPDGIKTIRKKAAHLTGIHHAFSKSEKPIQSEAPEKAQAPTIIPETTAHEMAENTTQIDQSEVKTTDAKTLSPIETLKYDIINTTTMELNILFFKMIGDTPITSWKKIESIDGSNSTFQITLGNPIEKSVSEDSLRQLLGNDVVKWAKLANVGRQLKVEVSATQTMTLSFSKGKVVNKDGSMDSYASLYFPETSQGFSFKGLPVAGELKVSEVRVYDSSNQTAIILKKPGAEKTFAEGFIGDVYDNASAFWMNLHNS